MALKYAFIFHTTVDPDSLKVTIKAQLPINAERLRAHISDLRELGYPGTDLSIKIIAVNQDTEEEIALPVIESTTSVHEIDFSPIAFNTEQAS